MADTVFEKPYRVLVSRRMAYGWTAAAKSYETLADAETGFANANGHNVTLQVAENIETWHRNGQWKTLRCRNAKKRTDAH